jgi:hypothetical protein
MTATTPHEPKAPGAPGSDLCAECGLPPWAEVHVLAKQARTAKARQARRRNVLERKADEYAAALRELGYTVLAPGAHRAKVRSFSPNICAECGGDPTDNEIHGVPR